MRKLIAMLLALLMALSLAACGSDDIEETTEATQGTTIPQETVSSNPLLAAELKIGAVRNGSDTKTIGTYAYIEITKETLKSITAEEYLEFCRVNVDPAFHNWVSIICDDHSGIQFVGSNRELATYGQIDSEGIIIEVIGFVNDTGNGPIYEDASGTSSVTNGSFDLGNMRFTLEPGMVADLMEDGSYLVTVVEGKAYAELYANDISSSAKEEIDDAVSMWHSAYTSGRGLYFSEAPCSIDIGRFTAEGETYCTVNDGGILLSHLDLSMTDTWYAYTVLFYCNGEDGNVYDYSVQFGKLLGSLKYVGLPLRN